MVEVVEWNGVLWRRYPESKNQSQRKYFKRITKFLHRAVWESVHGDIPKGFHIHHIDGDTRNNAIENLECINPKDHASRHTWSAERKEQQARFLSSIRELAKPWHSSDEGRAKHREIGAMAYKQFVPVPKNCEACGKVFEPKALGNRDKFCSNACKSAWRRTSGKDNEQRNCMQCGKSFVANRYTKSRTCGRSCANRLAWAKGRKGVRPDG